MPAHSQASAGLYAGRNVDLTISAASVTPTVVAPSSFFIHWTQRVIVQAGAGIYTHQLALLDSTGALSLSGLQLNGAIFTLRFEFEQSTNPTIEIYSDVPLGSPALLQTIVGPVDAPAIFIFMAEFTGAGGYVKHDGRYVV